MEYDTTDGGSLERVEDLGPAPQSIVKRWLLELKLADKREEDWRKQAEKVWKRYRQKDAKKNSFNILWANTETLRPAVYNSVPKPDVRRRFKDNDPLGKAVAEVLQRSITYSCDTYDFDGNVKGDVLDMLVAGRGLSRIRYVPTLSQVGVTLETHDEEAEQHDAGGEALEGDTEELTWEQAITERVAWDDFRMGPGKSWPEVQWIAFKHRLTRDELIEKFGEEIGNKIPLDDADDEAIKQEKDEAVAGLFKSALVWEIWDKEEAKVYFIAPRYKEAPALTLDDPLNLMGFYPIPRPLYAFEDSDRTVPVPLYELYREQAEELDRISERINTIIKGLKLRGVYDSTLNELSELMRGQDNDFIPAQNVTALLERGGLDKAIWTTDNLVKSAAQVLQVLYQQRDASKQVIYEITGIADIVRGASVASETATAQSIKDKWSNIRLKRMQQEVQRYIRDLIRIKAEIIGEKFSPETLATMTGLKFPTGQEKQAAMMQYQQKAMMAKQQGQQPPPQPDLPPSWDEIIQVLRDDAQRSYKIDIETDSTIAATVDQDMQALQQVTQAMGMVLKEFMPFVQANALPLDAMKELMLAVSRRARFGNAIEDAIDKMQQPPPPQDDGAAKAQADAQSKQQQMQQDMQLEQMRMQMEERSRQREMQMQMQFDQMKEQMVAEREERQAEREAILSHQQMMQDQAFERFKALLDARTKVEVAEISAGATLDAAQITAARQGTDDGSV